MPTTAFAADPRVRQHAGGAPGEHPEQPARFDAVMNQLKSSGLLERMLAIGTREASDDELALVHTREYISLAEREVREGRGELSTGDTPINAHSTEAARVAAGSALAATDAVLEGIATNAFCLVRPPGHHASAARGMGFCLFNSAAIAARYAQQRYGLSRILIADWDVHHGNGTQDIFYRDGSVLFFSTHQAPWYPGTGDASEQGSEAGAGTTINRPFPAGTGSAKIFGAFQELRRAAENFRPDLVILSAGFDSRVGDPLGHFLLTDDDFLGLTRLMTDLAARHCDGRLLSLLEGGYHLPGLALASECHVRGLLGEGARPRLGKEELYS